MIQLFSSLAAFSGAPGQGTYASANGVLDSWSQTRQIRGVPIIAVQWGNWGGGGMAVRSAGFISRMKSMGLGIIEPNVGLSTMDRILSWTMYSKYHLSVVVGNIFDWKTIRNMPSVDILFREFVSAGKTPLGIQVATEILLKNQLDEPAFKANVLKVVMDVAYRLTSIQSSEESLIAAGLDSLGVVQLQNEISSVLGVELPPTAIFNYPTPGVLVDYIVSSSNLTWKSSDWSLRTEAKTARADMNWEWVNSIVLDIVEGIAGRKFEEDEPLIQGGIDSLGLIQLRNKLAEKFTIEIPTTLALDYPNVTSISNYIVQNNDNTGIAVSMPSSRTLKPDEGMYSRLDSVVEILSLSCVYPESSREASPGISFGEAPIPKELVSVVPAARWDIERYYDPNLLHGTMNVRFGAFIRDIENFDNDLFQLSRDETAGMDPQVRLLLEQHWSTVDSSSAYSLGSLQSSSVYVGVMHIEYIQYLSKYGANINSNVTIGNGMDFLIGRVSYTFGFTGPCVSTHTACSSSLVAMHLARSSLKGGETATSLVSGVFTIILSDTMAGIANLNALSPVGRCKTFDVSADGYGRGEGCAVVLMGRNEIDNKNPQMKDSIAVLRSSAVNHVGKSASLTSPNGPAQTALIKSALEDGELHSDSIGMNAVHGTGTALGDPIETGAVGQALGRSMETSSRPLVLPSVKSYHGHTEGAAGLSGAVFALHSLDNQVRLVHIFYMMRDIQYVSEVVW